MSSPPPHDAPAAPGGSRSDSAPARFANLIGGISRRVRTLIVSGVLFLVLLVLALTLPVPYVVLTPGPTYNTLGTYSVDNQDEDIIGLDGRTANVTTGNLNLTTISYSSDSLTVFNALSAWLQDDEVVVPRSYIFPPGQTSDQVAQTNTADFQQSQENAVVAASCLLGYPKRFGVLSVTDGGPSSGKLKPEDALLSVDGHQVGNYDQLKAVLQNERPGASVPVTVLRANVRRTVMIILGAPDQGATGASLGIGVTSTKECLAPFEIDLGLGDSIGGPSAGLMFTLGIIAKVGNPKTYDLTQGRFIAGTGTIAPDGTVGPIGGIQLKMIAARAAGATLFLAPADNCTDVSGAVPSGLQVAKVSTLKDAVRDLQVPAAQQASLPGC